jgi:hypothetical protein
MWVLHELCWRKIFLPLNRPGVLQILFSLFCVEGENFIRGERTADAVVEAILKYKAPDGCSLDATLFSRQRERTPPQDVRKTLLLLISNGILILHFNQTIGKTVIGLGRSTNDINNCPQFPMNDDNFWQGINIVS